MLKNHTILRSALLTLALLGLVACNVPPRQVEAPALSGAGLQGTEWLATYIDGVTAVSQPRPRLRWTSPEQLSGSGGCNAFMGRAVVEQGAVKLGPLAATGKLCITAPQGQEDKFFKALEAGRQLRLEAGQLVLEDDAGRLLARFSKAVVTP